MVLPFASPSPFSLGFPEPEGHLYFNPPGQCSSECWSELEPLAAPPRGNLRFGFSCTDSSSGRGLRRDTRGYYQGVGTPGGLAGLVLPLSKCLVTGIPSLIGLSWEKEYPSLTMRACDGLSWDTAAGF